MSRENEKLVIPQSVLVSSSQILYPILCLICLLILVQRIRRRRGWFARFGRQMDSRKSLPESPGGKETAGTAVGQESNSNRDISHNVVVAPLPSASDVLQPLSHCTPLPSSGHLAAVLSQERQAGNRPSLTKPETPKESSSSPGPISTRTVSSGQVHASESYGQSANEEANTSPNHRGLSPSTSGAPVMNLQQQNPSTGISTASQGRQPSPDASGSGAVQSVQRHSETTHHLYNVDEQGVRTWKRQVVEYR